MSIDQHKLVFIEWVDSAGFPGRWHSLDAIQESNILVIHSVGWLVDKGKDYVTIVSTMDEQKESPQCQGDSSIPKAAIKRMVELKIPKAKPKPK